MLTQSRLKELLRYKPDTGNFFWRVKRGRMAAGQEAGCIRSDGYITIRLDGVYYLAHRLAFLYMTGAFPKEHADHRNTIKGDNRWPNLREANKSQNAANTHAPRVNSSGMKGVGWHKKGGKWRAVLNKKHLGYFDTKEGAAAAYLKAAQETFGEFARAA